MHRHHRCAAPRTTSASAPSAWARSRCAAIRTTTNAPSSVCDPCRPAACQNLGPLNCGPCGDCDQETGQCDAANEGASVRRLQRVHRQRHLHGRPDCRHPGREHRPTRRPARRSHRATAPETPTRAATDPDRHGTTADRRDADTDTPNRHPDAATATLHATDADRDADRHRDRPPVRPTRRCRPALTECRQSPRRHTVTGVTGSR